MSKMVVSFMDFFNNEMHMKLVDAGCWKDAIAQCPEWFGEEGIEALIECNSMEDACSLAFDMDSLFCVLGV